MKNKLLGSETPIVSVVIPVYNCEPFLRYTLDSVLAQKLKNFECILVDDCSPDNSKSICIEYAKKDKRIKIISHRANGGLSAARNTGLRFAKGKYVCFLDSDDLFMPEALSARVSTLEICDDENVVGTYCGSVAIPTSCKIAPQTHKVQLSRIDFITSKGNCPFNANQPLFFREKFIKYGSFDHILKQAEDYDMWMRILREGKLFVETNVAAVTYRTTENSMIKRDPLLHLHNSHSLFNWCNNEANIYTGSVLGAGLPRYIEQLNIAQRVLEFVGIAQAKGEDVNLLAEKLATYLPDYFKILKHHRPFRQEIMKGISRYLGNKCNKDPLLDNKIRRLEIAFERKCKAQERLAIKERKELKQNSLSTYAYNSSTIVREKLGQQLINIVFIPHKDYHVVTIKHIAKYVEKLGINFIILDISMHYRDERAVSKCKELDLPYIGYSNFLMGQFQPKLIISFNDWDPIARSILVAAQFAGIGTACIVEGIQDYDDADTKQSRHAYKTADYILLPGEHDRKYFRDSKQELYATGVPRITEFRKKAYADPNFDEKTALINSNFSYGVLEEHRDEWVQLAVSACQQAGFKPVISRHPADFGRKYKELQTSDDFYMATEKATVHISRFASGVLEALAMNRPTIYFNPHREKVDKFKEPMGAYNIASSRQELVEELQSLQSNTPRYLENADEFLDFHSGKKEDDTSLLCANVIKELVAKTEKKNISYDLFKKALQKIDLLSGCFNDINVLKERFKATYAEANLDNMHPLSDLAETFPIRNKIDIKDMPKSNIQFQNGPVNSYHAKINQIMDVLPDEVLNIQTGNALFDKGDYETALAIYFASYKKYGLKMYLGNAFLTAQRLKLPGIESTDDLLLRFSGNKFKYYYINLDQDHLRSRLMMEKNPETHLIRFPAFDGSEADIGQLIRDGYIMESCDREEIDISLGTLGCYMSHILLYEKRLLKDKCFDQFVVLEDDVKLCKDFERRIQDEILKYIGDWDLVVLDCYPKADGLKIAEGIYKIDGKFRLGRNGGTYGLLHNRNGCQKIYNKIKGLREMLPIDVYMHNECADLNIFYCKFNDNPLVSHNFGIGSTIECANVPKKYQEMLDAKIDM